MWLCAGENVTSDREVKYSAPLLTSRQRGAHLSATRADGWFIDITARALAWLNLMEKDGTDKRRRYQGLGYGDG